MARNNDLIYNAVISGFIAASNAGRDIINGNAGGDLPWATQSASAIALAVAVDALVSFDAELATSSSNPAPLAPTSGLIQGNQLAKTSLMTQIVTSALVGRSIQALTSDTIAEYAPAIQGQYAELASAFQYT